MPLIILVVLGQTILAFLLVNNVLLRRLAGPQEELNEVEIAVAVSDEPESIYRDLGEFLFNPADSTDGGGFRFVKTEFSFGVSPADVVPQIQDLNPLLRDVVLTILTSKKISEIDSPEDREFVKDEVRFSLNEHLTRGEILRVDITHFLIQ